LIRDVIIPCYLGSACITKSGRDMKWHS